MPTHRVPRASLDEDLKDIERKQGEHVLSMSPDPVDPTFYIIETRFAGAIETRSA